MNEDFVTFETAKKLKEKGFPQKCFGKYEMQGACYTDDGRFYIGGCITEVEKAYTAPTISQVLKWLREKKGIHIEVSPVFRTCKFSSTIYYTKNGQFIKHFAKLSKTYDSYEEAVIDKMDFVIDRLI